MKIIDEILYENYIIKIINNIDIYSIQEQNKESTKIFFDTGSLHKIYIDEKEIYSLIPFNIILFKDNIFIDVFCGNQLFLSNIKNVIIDQYDIKIYKK